MGNDPTRSLQRTTGQRGGSYWAGPCETGHVTEEEANQARWHDLFGGPSARRRYEPVDEEAERWYVGASHRAGVPSPVWFDGQPARASGLAEKEAEMDLEKLAREAEQRKSLAGAQLDTLRQDKFLSDQGRRAGWRSSCDASAPSSSSCGPRPTRRRRNRSAELERTLWGNPGQGDVVGWRDALAAGARRGRRRGPVHCPVRPGPALGR